VTKKKKKKRGRANLHSQSTTGRPTQVRDANTVFVAVVRSSREHKVGGSKLLEVTKTLKLWRVDHFHCVQRESRQVPPETLE
jgi:hypothetical protein